MLQGLGGQHLGPWGQDQCPWPPHAARCGQRQQAKSSWAEAWPALEAASPCAVSRLSRLARPSRRRRWLWERCVAGAGRGRDWGPRGKRVPTRCPEGAPTQAEGPGPGSRGPAAAALASEPARAAQPLVSACRPHSPAPAPWRPSVPARVVVVESGACVDYTRTRTRRRSDAEEEDGSPASCPADDGRPTVCVGGAGSRRCWSAAVGVVEGATGPCLLCTGG